MNEPTKKLRINSETLKKIRYMYVEKGMTPLAITASVRMDLEKLADVIIEYNLNAERELFLEENPNLTAQLALKRNMQKILKLQQENEDVSPADKTFMLKYQEAEQKGAFSKDLFYNWPVKKLDEEIASLFKKLYEPEPKRKFARRPNSSLNRKGIPPKTSQHLGKKKK